MVDRRKTRRHNLERQVWIEIQDAVSQPCQLQNISSEGARLSGVSLPEIPDEFCLNFVPDGSVARKCRVVWRDVQDIGVRFTARRIEPGQPGVRFLEV